MRIALAALALSACAGVAAPPGMPPAAESCDAEAARALVGRAASAEMGAEALRLSGARRLRWIRPGDMVTMDYSPGRLNVYLDGGGRIESLACG